MIHLDTSFLVDLLRETSRGKPGPASAFLVGIENEELAASVFVQCELYAGAELSRRPKAERSKVDELSMGVTVVYPDPTFPITYARLFATLERAEQRIGNMDLLIAASAVTAEAPLVAGNIREFSRISELELLTY